MLKSISDRIIGLWNFISYLGLDESHSFLERRRILFLNRISAAAILLLWPMALPVVNPTSWLDTTFILIFNLFILFISSRGKHLVARYLFVILNSGGVYVTSVTTDYFQGEYLYFPLIVAVMPLIMDYSNKWNIFFSSIIVFGFYTAFELGLDVSELNFTEDSPLGLNRLNFFYVMLGCWVISYLYLDLTNRQQLKLQSANDRLIENEKELIRAKEEAEKSAKAKMHFLSVMSHEIRTPLNTVIGLSALMKERDIAPEIKENIELINFASNNLFSIVNDILDWSKIEVGKVELEKIDFNLKDTISKLAASTELLCAKKEINFKSNIDPTLPEWVTGDPTRITQILNNLLNNAVKFTSSGDVVLAVELRKKNDDKVLICFSVSDSGIGMSQEQVAKIFNQFEQADRTVARKYGGSGLGLSIAQKIVTLMGGEMFVESEDGKGSKFAFELEFMVGSEITEENSTFSNTLKGKNILVVDDNQLNLVVAQNFLQQWGANYHGVLSGIDALKSLEKNSYDLVLMDISMPEMDGFETSKEIRRRGYRNLPIVALTASAMIRDQEKIFSSGMNDCESKPFKPASLYEKLTRLL